VVHKESLDLLVGQFIILPVNSSRVKETVVKRAQRTHIIDFYKMLGKNVLLQ